MIGALYAAGLLLVALVGLPIWFRYTQRRYSPISAKELEDQRLTVRDRFELRDAHLKRQDDLRLAAVQSLVGLAVLIGAFLTYQAATADRGLTRQAQASERFATAIGQLNSELPEAKIGGIYGLEQIARLAPEENRLPVTEVLVAYLHRQAKLSDERPEDAVGRDLRTRQPDVQAVLTVLGRREIRTDDPQLDLRELQLRSVDLRSANLSGADLGYTNLRYADLRGADFSGAELEGTNLIEADLRFMILRGADLRWADFSNSGLRGADLRDVKSIGGVDLGNTYLRGADLRGADLSHANLSGADLRDARASRSTQWPKGFNWQGAGVLLVD
jgi:hypothetical protein